MEGIEHDLDKMRGYSMNKQHIASGTKERMAQGVRKISDSTPVEKETKLDKMRELE